MAQAHEADRQPATNLTRYGTFKATQHYHAAVAALLDAVEQAILSGYDEYDAYIGQCCADVIRAYVYLTGVDIR